MDRSEIRAQILEIIEDTTSIPADEIGDEDHFVDDLDLDSLTLLEIGVSVDRRFKLGLDEERMSGMSNVQFVVDLVDQTLRAKES